jgi:hypothetical protein
VLGEGSTLVKGEIGCVAFESGLVCVNSMGFGQCSRVTPLIALALTALFVLVFGPIAYWVLARSGSQSFDVRIETVSQLPTAYLD